MSRMLDALKVLDTRSGGVPPDELPSRAVTDPPRPQPVADDHVDCVDAPREPAVDVAYPTAAETCALPTATEVAEHYLQMAAEINRRLACNYCNVLLFVAADHWVEPCFSMTHAAQALATQSTGDILLVDGDLRSGRLSKSVARPGPGMIEAMLGEVEWPDIIHPTNLASIDFVSCGHGQVPTVERPNFGWGALRPLYRTVVIGLARQGEPETTWLAARCDAVYLVLSRPHTRRGVASAAINTLRACGANVAGSVVVND